MKIHISYPSSEFDTASEIVCQLWDMLPNARIHVKTDDMTGRHHIYLTTVLDNPDETQA